jgi:hypothetical protein
MTIKAEYLAAFDDVYQAQFRSHPRPAQYKARKAAYRPGSIVALPLVEDDGAPVGSYGLALVRGCNWLAAIHWFTLDRMFDHLPTEAEALAAVTPGRFWYWEVGGDAFFHTGHWRTVAEVDPWRDDDWPEVMEHIERENVAVRHRLVPNKREVREIIPLTDEIASLPSWGHGVASALSFVSTLTLSHTHDDFWVPLPVGAERHEAFLTWRETHRHSESQEPQMPEGDGHSLPGGSTP